MAPISEGGTMPRSMITPAFAENNVPVFFACNDGYFPHVLATIASLLENAHTGNYDLVILYTRLAEANLALAGEWIRRWPNASLRFFDMGGIMAGNGDFASETYYRLFLPWICRAYDKVVYLDADLVLFTDVAELYGIDLGECLLGACHDRFVEGNPVKHRGDFSKFPDYAVDQGYFCAGVMVLNLRKMREEKTAETCFEALRRMGPPYMNDQTLLNGVCAGKVLFIDEKWDVLVGFVESFLQSREEKCASAGPGDIWQIAKKSMAIVHYAGNKPWNPGFLNPYGEYYWKYSAMTPFHESVRQRALAVRPAWAFRKYALTLFQKYKYMALMPFRSEAGRQKYLRKLIGYEVKLRRLKDCFAAMRGSRHA
jgi:lipopolysaccharide biosynthesis glycosyltransferase